MQEDNVTSLVPLLLVRSMEASLRFYCEGLAFELEKKWEPEGAIRWCLLKIGRAHLMLQTFGPGEPKGEPGYGVGLNFICQDAIAIYHEAANRNLKPETPFVGNGMWVTGFTDPDGYRLYFESNTGVPEGMVYSEHPAERA